MHKLITTALLAFFSLAAFAQDKKTDTLRVLYQTKQYNRIVEQYAADPTDLSAKALYYIGFAYFMQEDDSNCIKFMDRSISKDPNDPSPHFIKAATLNYQQQYKEAIKGFQTAIRLKADNADYYSGLGDAYYHLKEYEQALEAYKKAIEQPNAPDWIYSLIGQVYSQMKDNKNAITAYYTAKSKIAKTSDSYLTVLFNIGTLELQEGNYDKGEAALLELVELAPTDYHAYAKLTQVCYHRKEYEKAKLHKDKLYEAYKNGQLKDNLAEKFCFDQFKWKDKHLQAFERFEDSQKDKIYYKHIFYILDKEKEVDFTIQTEYSPIAAELGKYTYVLGMNKGNRHYTFPIGFTNNPDYDQLKQRVIDILEGKLKPSSSSGPSK